MNWNSTLIKEIFVQKNKEKSEDRDNLLRLVSRSLYGEAIHYALELIQNAEDENSSLIKFIFDKDRAVVINDGRPFDEDDVWGICSVKTGRKKRKIGFFGIGFKAVFNITTTPQIISGNFNFELHDFIYPKALTTIPEIAEKHYTPEKGAVFALPYCPELASPQTLIENFSLIDEKLLLFLDNLKKLSFADLINGAEWTIHNKPEASTTFSVEGQEVKYSTVSLINTLTGETKWKVFHRVLPVKDKKIIPEGKEGIENTRITIAFPLDSEVRDKIKKNGVVYCYLPTKKRTDLPFLIQADFLPTVGRENISEHPWNAWLMEELGALAGHAIDKIKEDEALVKTLYDFIPLANEVQDELIKHLYKALFDTLKQKEIAKTAGQWLKAERCLIPDDDSLRDILTEADLRLLFHEDVSYIHQSLSEKEQFTRAENILFELGAKQISANEVIEFLQKQDDAIKKSEVWFLSLFDYLRTVFDTTKKSYLVDFPWNWEEEIKTLFKKLEVAKFILTDDEKIVSLKDPAMQDRLICYPQNIDLYEIHQLFTAGEIIFLNRYFQESSISRRKEDSPESEEKRKRVKEWFDSIGVKKYFRQAHIIKEVILPKFTTGKYKKYEDLEIYNLLNYIRAYWSMIESEIQNKKFSSDIIHEIKDAVLLKAYAHEAGKQLEEYKKPEEIYFSKRYGKNEVMEDLFEGIKGFYFLSPYYLNRENRETRKKRGRQKVEYSWKKFFEILGVWSSPRVVKDAKGISIKGTDKYKWVKKEYSPSGMHELHGNSHSEDIEKLIEYCSKIAAPDESRKRMPLLWESLEKDWKFYKDKGYCSTKYKWKYQTEQSTDYPTSSFLEFLRDSRWVPSRNGNFCKAGDVFLFNQKNLLLLGDGLDYVDLKANEAFLKDLGVRIEPEISEVTEHLKSYRENNPQPVGNKIEKLKVIYSFLQGKLEAMGDKADKQIKMEEMKRDFYNHELFYLPREDRAWWKPSQVFWDDLSEHFETLRGYVEHNGVPIYDTSLKPYFSSVGVIDRLSLQDCFAILEDLKAGGNLDYYKKFINKAYSLINSILKQKATEEPDWEKLIFLSKKGNFLCPSKLYYCDNEEYEKLFGANVEIIWLPFHWDNVKEMLQAGGFKRLSENISVTKKFDSLSEIEGDIFNQLVRRLLYVKNYLNRKKFELFSSLRKEGVFKRIDKLQSYETQKILLDFVLKMDGSEPIAIKNVEKDAYFSIEENRLYKSSQVPLFSTPIAKELSKLFSPAEDEVFSVLDSLFGASDEEELNKKLGHFGIQEPVKQEEEPTEGIKIIQKKDETQDSDSEKKEEEAESKEGTGEKPQPPDEFKKEVPKYDLIDPDELIFEDAEEKTPYVKTDGPQNVPPRTIKLRKAHEGESGEPRPKPREKANRADAEAIALELVMRFEEDFEAREADDRHKQLGIGYDILSKGKDGDERYIEVKHFRGDAAPWELTPHQWKKAEEEGEKYFVYIVSGLRLGYTPNIEIIQNPVKYLTPDPPSQKKFSDWKNGVLKVVKSLKV